MLQSVTAEGAKRKLTPADLVCTKPDETFIWRQELPHCDYDFESQTRLWDQSDRMKELIMSTGAPTSSTQFDGEADE